LRTPRIDMQRCSASIISNAPRGASAPTNASAKLTGTARLAGSSKSTTKTGKGKVTMRLHSSKRLKKAPKVVLKIASGKTKTSLTVKAK